MFLPCTVTPFLWHFYDVTIYYTHKHIRLSSLFFFPPSDSAKNGAPGRDAKGKRWLLRGVLPKKRRAEQKRPGGRRAADSVRRGVLSAGCGNTPPSAAGAPSSVERGLPDGTSVGACRARPDRTTVRRLCFVVGPDSVDDLIGEYGGADQIGGIDSQRVGYVEEHLE